VGRVGWLLLLLAVATGLNAADTTLAEVRSGLKQLAIDPANTFRVRDLLLARGGVKIYLTAGVLAFATPIHSRIVAAVFTTQAVDAGDAEMLTFPPNGSERASLASFNGSPNLDEHFTSAVLFFGDDTAAELLGQIQRHPLHPVPEMAAAMQQSGDAALRLNAGELDVRLTAALLDQHTPEHGFFYAMVAGRDKGPFDFAYQPDQPDSVTLGKVASKAGNAPYFQIWSSFHPRGAPAVKAPASVVNDFRIESTVHADLSLSAQARFDYMAQTGGGRVINLLLSSRFQARSATVDGQPAEVCQHPTALSETSGGAAPFLIIAATALAPGTHHQVAVEYDGTVIRRTLQGTYFVDDRNSWYPFVNPMRASFDLIFHCPESLQLVATGEPVSEDVISGVRNVHRKTIAPQALAGFNLGEYSIDSSQHGPYRIEVFSNKAAGSSAGIPAQTAAILERYTALWGPLNLHSMAISPIEGYFGQGFPGLIYLSDISYTLEQDRPAALRNPRLDSFFSQMLLPHEVAHQWWGNRVASEDYRSNWIVEALANFVAMQYLEASHGKSAADELLNSYRQELAGIQQGKPTESLGPVVFGERLLNNYGIYAWHAILYEKGTWIFQMLRQRMGDAAFAELLRRLLHNHSVSPLGNEDLRREAAALMPAGAPDQNLNAFFETWVYGTGIPTLSITGQELMLSHVDDDYLVDVPLTCQGVDGKRLTRWLHASAGTNPLPGRNCRIPDRDTFLYF
jgi:hypothetical protein